MNVFDEDLVWYIIVENGLYAGFTNSEYIANEYKRCGNLNDISITRYESSRYIVSQIVYEKYGGTLSEHYRIKPIVTRNKRLVVLTSEYRKDEYLYDMVDVSYDVDNLLLSLYNMADILDYFVDGDKLIVIIKIMIIKYIKKVLEVYHEGYIFDTAPPVDELYILAYNDAITVIKKL